MNDEEFHALVSESLPVTQAATIGDMAGAMAPIAEKLRDLIRQLRFAESKIARLQQQQSSFEKHLAAIERKSVE